MKIGLVSAILEDYDFKKMIDTVSEIGYECVEVACWPKAKAERRYAGVSHIDVANLGDKEAEEILSYCKEKNVEISSLAFYPNKMPLHSMSQIHYLINHILFEILLSLNS